MRIALRAFNGKIVTAWDEYQGQHPLIANRDAIGPGETFDVIVLDGPTPPPPNPGQDAIDMSAAIITRESPDVRSWPKTAAITSLSLSATANMTLDFTAKTGATAWPKFQATGFAPGDLMQYTLGVGCNIGGLWYLSTCIDCSGDYIPTGPALAPEQLSSNFYYYAGLPLDDYNPKPGEMVAWFVVSGVCRRENQQAPGFTPQRSNVVLVPFTAGTYRP